MTDHASEREGALSGSEAARASALYSLSPYTVAPDLVRSVAVVKEAAALCNEQLGYLPAPVATAVARAARELQALDDEAISAAFPLDAFQGGAGTSTNMAVNEWIAEVARNDRSTDVTETSRESESNQNGGTTRNLRSSIDPHDHVNLHQSTNDVMPTALRLMMHDRLVALEAACESLQGALQAGEAEYDAVLKPGRTQLRDALVTTLGREFGTWAHSVGRDRWRCFKARERIREVNLGGTAIGSGAGAPRRYVLGVTQVLQRLVPHPISRAEHLTEATSNYDSVVEAMQAPKCLAVTLRRIASDIRLLASGPQSAIGELVLPALIPGSSIMAGKINPVVPEAVIQCSERILANDTLIARLAGMSELELNAFFPAIAHTVHESLVLAEQSTRSLTSFVEKIGPDRERCATGLASSYAEAVALLPLVGYPGCEVLVREARRSGVPLRSLLERDVLLTADEADALFAPGNLTSLGYDETLYSEIRERRGDALNRLVAGLGEPRAERDPKGGSDG